MALLFVCLVSTQIGYTQKTEESPKKGFKYNNNFDLALGVGSGSFSSTLSWVKFHGIGKKQNFKIGYGIRLTNYVGSAITYKTADAKLIADKKIEELQFASAQTNSLNLSINLQYSLSQKIELGFNIDALGVSFGGEQNGTKADVKVATASPTSGNVLLIGNNDIGSLNSEFYIRYWVSQKFAIRAGISYLFSEYTTTVKLADDNNRYRATPILGFVAFTFSPYR